jgi:hypothetical protein
MIGYDPYTLYLGSHCVPCSVKNALGTIEANMVDVFGIWNPASYNTGTRFSFLKPILVGSESLVVLKIPQTIRDHPNYR